MNEATFWSSFVKPTLHVPSLGRVAWKVPAEIRAGLPDVWWSRRHSVDPCGDRIAAIGGWLELKYLDAWPKRPGTPITIDVTPMQLAHLREAASGGARTGVLLGVAREWYLFDPARLTSGHRVIRIEVPGLSVAGGSLSVPEALRRAVYGLGG